MTWWALLLAIVPAPLAAAAAFAPAPVNRVAAVAGVAVLIAGIAGGIFFTLPCYRLTIRSSSDITRFVLLLVAGVAVSRRSLPGPAAEGDRDHRCRLSGFRPDT